MKLLQNDVPICSAARHVTNGIVAVLSVNNIMFDFYMVSRDVAGLIG